MVYKMDRWFNLNMSKVDIYSFVDEVMVVQHLPFEVQSDPWVVRFQLFDWSEDEIIPIAFSFLEVLGNCLIFLLIVYVPSMT